MHKVKKLFLFLIPIICGDLGAACVSNDHNKVLIEEGSLINKDQPEIKFKSAVFELDKYLLEGVTFNTCEDDSSWEIAADKAVLEDDVLSISNAKVKLYNIPIFWLGNISLDKDKEINIPNFGITDSNFDFSYKFEGGNENAMFTLEPIYTKSKFGVSLKAKFDDGENKTSFQSFAIDDNESSWVFRINSLVKITEDLRWKRVDIKTLNLLPPVLAKQEAIESGCDEAWMTDANGYITEGSSSNAWILIKNKLITTPTSSSILKGITRTTLIRSLKNKNIQLIEKRFNKKDIKKSSEAFITSATQFVMPVIKIDNDKIGNGRVGKFAQIFRESYMEAIQLK